MSDADATDDEPASDREWNSGPFCRHYGDPSDCETECGACGHSCHYHHDEECMVEGCQCAGWEEKEEQSKP